MTGNFKEKLGEGGFRYAYKGNLSDGHLIAVKMLSKFKGDGQKFINEVATIRRFHHVNVVQLIGFFSDKAQRALICDYMPNGRRRNFNKEEENASQHFFPLWIYDQLDKGEDVDEIRDGGKDEKEICWVFCSFTLVPHGMEGEKG
ncbi:hypothetical protein ACLOJK_008758 [Asimina triloba]